MSKLSKQWVECVVGDTCKKLITGKTPSMKIQKYYENPTYNWFAPSDFDDSRKWLVTSKRKLDESAVLEKKASIYPAGTLLLVAIGATVGKIGLVEQEASSNQQITAIVFNNKINSEFAYYWFKHIKQTVIQNASSATLPILNQKGISNLPFRYPTLPEQKRIVSKLDALFERIDKSIALLEENIKQTEHLMASVLDEVFSEIDKKHWVELKTISKLITKGSSPNWQGVKYVDEPGVLFITSKNVGNHKLILGDKKTYLETKFNEIQPRSILQKDDILLNIVGASIGRTAKFNLDELANINQAVCLIRLNKELVNVDYMLQFFNSSICISYMFDKKVDNARANLSMGNIQKFLIPTPPIEEQERISMKIGTLLDNIELLRNEQNDKLNNLKALKESILDKAFKGEL
jgi:type I restriction enzyme S subunit